MELLLLKIVIGFSVGTLIGLTGVGGGVLLLPLLIFFTGALILGRYEGASLWRTYATVFVGLVHGSIASWVVVLGPYLLLLLQKGLRAWWRVGANPA